jgi:predicted transcriptional regulator
VRNKSGSLTEREAQILEVLWERKRATADEIRALLPGLPHDSTVRTLLRVMEHKGLVAHDVVQRSFVYRPRIARSRAKQQAVRRLLQRLFGGSVRSLVLQLLDDEEITPEELQRLAQGAPLEPEKSRKRGTR